MDLLTGMSDVEARLLFGSPKRADDPLSVGFESEGSASFGSSRNSGSFPKDRDSSFSSDAFWRPRKAEKPPASAASAPKPARPAKPGLPRFSEKFEREVEIWRAWKDSPSPETTDRLLKAVRPIVDKAVTAHVGESSPVLRSKARRMALDVLPRFDPNKSALSTFLITQLQSLKREARNQTAGIRTSDRMHSQLVDLLQTENQLLEELGRPPNDEETADRMGISIERVGDIRKRSRTALAHGQFVDRESGEVIQPAVVSDTKNLWIRMVYDDLDPTGKLIMEHTLGLRGKPVLTNKEIARRLRLSPGAVSQRKATLQKLLDRESSLNLLG